MLLRSPTIPHHCDFRKVFVHKGDIKIIRIILIDEEGGLLW